MKKLRLRSLVVLVHGTNRSPRLAERKPGRPDLSLDDILTGQSQTWKTCGILGNFC